MSDPLSIVTEPIETVHATDEASRDFEAFFEGEYSGLFSALSLITRNRHEAEEIAQDAFLKLWERWDRRGDIDDPAGYLYRTALNAFRKRYRRTALALRKTIREIPPDDGIAAIEAQDATMRALAVLSERQRAAVVLVDLLGYPSEEAAHMLGVSASTLRSHTSRAHLELRKTMGEKT